jgi:hypothetical protein
MSEAAFIILAAGDTHESLGRVVNAFMGALEYIESDGDVPIIFDGAGTKAAAEFAKPDHKYHDLFERVRKRVTGVCSYCAGAFKVKDKIEAANLPLSDQFQGHLSFKQLIEQGFDVLTF